MKNKVKVRVFGDLELLTEKLENREMSSKLLKSTCKLVEQTKNNEKY
jgi:hypothetical protein